MGVCLHSKYGGWFAMRCVFLFKNVILNEHDLTRPILKDPLCQNYDCIIELLKNFNYNWKNSKYRDAICVAEKYSDLQVEYFTMEPKHRKEMLKEWLKYSNVSTLLVDFDLKIKEKKRKEFLLNNFYFE